VGVIRHEENWSRARRLAHKLMGGKSDVKRVGLEVARDPKCRLERSALRSWQPAKLRKNGVKHLMQACERELGLGFHAHRRQRPKARGGCAL
jgi:predicted secreted Zn-dependent protease